MFGRSASSLLVALLLLVPTQAKARTQNFTTGSPLGLGVLAGLENRPHTAFAAGNQTTTSNYSSYFAFEPFFDLVNVCFRGHVGWHFYPEANGQGTDRYGSFTESRNAGSLELGARVLLSPFLGAKADSRLYFVIGVGNTTVKLKNSRKYTSGRYFNQVNVEQLQGSGVELNGGLGFEFFLVQNWSLQIEGGYADRTVSTFKYSTSTDVQGSTVSSSTTATDSAGNNKGFQVWSPYGQLVMNINL